jgi:UPF0716 protein FxsA
MWTAVRKGVLLKRFMILLVALCVVDLALLLVLADFTSWKVPVLLVLATALLGLAVLRHAMTRLGRSVEGRLTAGDSAGEVLVDATLILVAGILLVFPGVMSDVAGLLLLIPPVRWLLVALLRRRCVMPIHRGLRFLRLSGETSIGEAFIDRSRDERSDRDG